MGIGVSIFLIAVGAILAFAVNASISGLDIAVVGYILMIVGVLGLIMTAFIWGPRRTAARGDVVEERRVYDDRI
ncbi:MAG: hypothetical protein QOI54_1564 [Actinomycetota bacterium]|jgi:hypothetical protein|nr:hypothetical protein [Actinomycetota bacterium]